MRGELKRVTWPTKIDVARWTGVVIVALLFFGVFVAILDNFVVTPLLVLISGADPSTIDWLNVFTGSDGSLVDSSSAATGTEGSSADVTADGAVEGGDATGTESGTAEGAAGTVSDGAEGASGETPAQE